MNCLLDTGVLLRAFDALKPEYAVIRTAVRRLRENGRTLVVTLQNIAEFWNVSTRPAAQNGLGLTHARVRRRLEMIEVNCQVLTESPGSYVIWKGLVRDLSITGVAVHDARLASVMLEAGISTIMTLNERDFRRFAGIKVMSPTAIAAGEAI